MTPSEWMEAKGLSQAKAGELLGVRSGTVCRWVTGQRRPTVDMAFRIEEATGGAVPASSWRTTPPAKVARGPIQKRRRRSKVRHARSVAQPAP
jgi:transcriptional regulator with XRE-family HTH domain